MCLPSFLFGGRSGGDLLVSGNPFSGLPQVYAGGIQLRVDRNASGNLYLGFSGGVTINSGGFFLSGGGLNDGMQLGPGDAFLVPPSVLGPSGSFNIYFGGDPAASGFARLDWFPIPTRG